MEEQEKLEKNMDNFILDNISGKVNIFMTPRMFRTHALLVLVKQILELDYKIREEFNIPQFEEKYVPIFKDDEKEDIINQEKSKFFNFLLSKNFTKEMVQNISKRYPIIVDYYNCYKDIYNEFGLRKGEHIPVLFASYAVTFLMDKGVLKKDDTIFNTSKVNGILRFGSNTEKAEREEYATLVAKMWEKSGKINNQTKTKRNTKNTKTTRNTRRKK